LGQRFKSLIDSACGEVIFLFLQFSIITVVLQVGEFLEGMRTVFACLSKLIQLEAHISISLREFPEATLCATEDKG
jgi:hypothetical protein